MTKYFLVTEDGTRIALKVVENMDFGGTQSVIVYESPGTNGGTVLTTGRTNNIITLTGRILLPFKSEEQRANPAQFFPNPLQTLNGLKSIIQRQRDKGRPVRLIAPVDNDDSGQYIIEDFSASVVMGIEAALPFTIVLREFRQANIQRSSVNLVAFEPANIFIQTLVDRNLLFQ